MVDPFKVFWVLTNSTYIVTKFIRIGGAEKNDSTPFFDKVLYETEVDENEDIGQIILNITARTNNEVGPIRYQITSGNVGGAFAVQNTSGAIYVAGKIDYETIKKYELKLEASSNLRKNHTTVIIHIRDTNDNPPIFERQTYKTQINEEDNEHLPKRIIKVQATDADKDRPVNIIYFLSGQGIDPDNPKNSKFEVDKHTGEIFVLSALDRDQPEGRPLWRFTVFAQDEGGEGLVGYADVQVVLKDINDNAPIFSQEVYLGNVTENGTTGIHVVTITAIDYDDSSSGINANIIYSIEKNVVEEETGVPIFEIEPHSGVIRTAVCCLDRERTPEYFLQVVATDGGGLKATGTAIIQVIDINDKPPLFVKDEWFAEVDETDGSSIPDAPILTVMVHDDDEIKNFYYKIVENSGYGADKFKIVQNSDSSGSVLINKPLDFEDVLQSNGFRFQIQVTDTEDQTNKYHTVYSWVIIRLRDINDNSPIFHQSSINVLVSENIEIGRILATFKAVDPDQNGNSRVSYAIDERSNKNRLFAISRQGTVSIQRNLDREESKNHHIIILAVDDGVPSRTSTATLNVAVQDINDNAPTLLKNYRPVILENISARDIIEIHAIDKDDYSIGNGPPFQFLMDPNASLNIRNSFAVEYNPKGDGTAIIKSLRSFDREQQKEYNIPIIIKDSGNPIMTGTSTLIVTIGDVNDNNMKEAVKKVSVYKLQGQQAEMEIGRIYVYDLDDWDLPDKKFFWEIAANPGFKLNEQTGMITMGHNMAKGTYTLRFKVFDQRYIQTVSATVVVTIKEITLECVLNSGSMRLANTSDEDFIAVWDYKEGDLPKSKQEKFREKIAEILKVDRQNIEIFSVQSISKYPSVTDVRFSAYIRSEYLQAVKINGLILINKEDIEKFVGVNISMVGLNELDTCNKAFHSNFNSSALSYLVDANKTALVSTRIEVLCSMKTSKFDKIRKCSNNSCLTDETCLELENSISCQCRQGYKGPMCQKTLLSFQGDGWAWYSPLKISEQNHLNLDFITLIPDGLLLYHGPLVTKSGDGIFSSDFISIEVKQGLPRLLMNFGSDTVELTVKTKPTLNNGKWHRLDIFWNTESIRMVVDFCQPADLLVLDDDASPGFDERCQAQGRVPTFDDYLNISAPLQLGGRWPQSNNSLDYRGDFKPTSKGFDGCIGDIFYNSELIDVNQPAFHENLHDVCYHMEVACKQVQNNIGCTNGYCQGNRYEAECHCHPGWYGPNCSLSTVPTTFKSRSHVKYALNFDVDRFTTQIQLRFRTRKKQSELFRLSDQHGREYAIIEINDSHVCFRYNLNSVRTEEKQLVLSGVSVDDGKWHVIIVERYGSVAILKLDSGNNKLYNESFEFVGHQFLLVDKHEGVHVGENPDFTESRRLDMDVEFQTGSCIDDVRLNGKHLPLPPALNGTQWGQATIARNLERTCLSNNPCGSIVCPDPLKCVDLWNHYECRCREGRMLSPDSQECVDKNECLDSPCLNGGICINLGSDLLYKCKCRSGFRGNNCELGSEEQRLKISIGALSAVFLCLFAILALITIFVVYRRCTKYVKKKPPAANTEISKNVIGNNEEGREDEMTGVDITSLQTPINKIRAEADESRFEMDVLRPKGQPAVMTVTFLEDHTSQPAICFDVIPSNHLKGYSYRKGENITETQHNFHSDTKV